MRQDDLIGGYGGRRVRVCQVSSINCSFFRVLGDIIQTRAERSGLRGGTRYTDGFHLAALSAGDVKRVLFIGGGGCIGPRQFAASYPDAQIDVVEVDAQIAALAELTVSRRSRRLGADVRRRRSHVVEHAARTLPMTSSCSMRTAAAGLRRGLPPFSSSSTARVPSVRAGSSCRTTATRTVGAARSSCHFSRRSNVRLAHPSWSLPCPGSTRTGMNPAPVR